MAVTPRRGGSSRFERRRRQYDNHPRRGAWTGAAAMPGEGGEGRPPREGRRRNDNQPRGEGGGGGRSAGGEGRGGRSSGGGSETRGPAPCDEGGGGLLCPVVVVAKRVVHPLRRRGRREKEDAGWGDRGEFPPFLFSSPSSPCRLPHRLTLPPHLYSSTRRPG